MRALVLAAAFAACAAAPAQAAKLDLMVVGKRAVLRAPAPVRSKTARVRVTGRTCRVAAATPLAALARTSLRLRLEDFARCSKRPAEAAGLYVRGIGRDVETATDGWVYKVGHRTPGTGAGDPSARLKAGARLLWFWCRSGARGCQRTLDVTPATSTAAPGQAVRLTVTAYDDEGRGEPASGATVRLGGATATTDAAGLATVAVPAQATGTLRAVATADRLVRSFPAEVRIG